MAKAKITKIKFEKPIMPEPQEEEDLDPVQKDLQIKEAQVKDDFCNYKYELLAGVGKGDIIDRKGSALVHQDMKDALTKLNVHLAIIDDAFKYKGLDITDVDLLHDHDITEVFHVTGIKRKGSEESPKVILVGDKFVSVSGRMGLETPQIQLFSGSYQWYNELKEAVDNFCREVELYMEGKKNPEYEQGDLFPIGQENDSDFEQAEV